jgi:hypothetical protein
MVQSERSTSRNIEEYKEALSNFHPPSPDQEVRNDEGFTLSPDPLVDEYFAFVAIAGRPLIPWETIRPAFLWKLKTVMDDMHIKEAEELDDGAKKEELINDKEISDSKAFILMKAQSFDGIPFTIQRLCELLMTPNKHYHYRTDKYLHALERTINIVTTVTETGDRITGVVDEISEEDEEPRIESNFIVSVDEVDEPLPSIPQTIQEASTDHEEMQVDNNGAAQDAEAPLTS